MRSLRYALLLYPLERGKLAYLAVLSDDILKVPLKKSWRSRLI
jgi:hypothetical protein